MSKGILSNVDSQFPSLSHAFSTLWFLKCFTHPSPYQKCSLLYSLKPLKTFLLGNSSSFLPKIFLTYFKRIWQYRQWIRGLKIFLVVLLVSFLLWLMYFVFVFALVCKQLLMLSFDVFDTHCHTFTITTTPHQYVQIDITTINCWTARYIGSEIDIVNVYNIYFLPLFIKIKWISVADVFRYNPICQVWMYGLSQ